MKYIKWIFVSSILLVFKKTFSVKFVKKLVKFVRNSTAFISEFYIFFLVQNVSKFYNNLVNIVFLFKLLTDFSSLDTWYGEIAYHLCSKNFRIKLEASLGLSVRL